MKKRNDKRLASAIKKVASNAVKEIKKIVADNDCMLSHMSLDKLEDHFIGFSDYEKPFDVAFKRFAADCIYDINDEHDILSIMNSALLDNLHVLRADDIADFRKKYGQAREKYQTEMSKSIDFDISELKQQIKAANCEIAKLEAKREALKLNSKKH